MWYVEMTVAKYKHFIMYVGIMPLFWLLAVGKEHALCAHTMWVHACILALFKIFWLLQYTVHMLYSCIAIFFYDHILPKFFEEIDLYYLIIATDDLFSH